MKLLCFQAERFAWKPFSQTLADAPPGEPGEVEMAVVAFVHAETADEPEDRRSKVFRHTLKHLKWLANKRELKSIVLHSFTHLGGDSARSDFAEPFLLEMKERLESTGYSVSITPFGWFCSWDIQVFGDSLAKVWKEI